MKANELMIGDWMQFANGVQKVMVVGIKMDARYREKDPIITVENNRYHWIEKPLDELKPIPLTAEILEANGFSVGKYKLPVSGNEIDKYSYVDLTNHIKECVLLPLTKNCTWSFGSVDGMEVPVIEYVHELQHALRLCGIDKDIIIKKED